MLPHALAVAVELDTRQFQLELVPLGHHELALLTYDVRRIRVEQLQLEIQAPGLARLEPVLGFFHDLVGSQGICSGGKQAQKRQ